MARNETLDGQFSVMFDDFCFFGLEDGYRHDHISHLGGKEHHLQQYFGRGYVSSLEGT